MLTVPNKLVYLVDAKVAYHDFLLSGVYYEGSGAYNVDVEAYGSKCFT